MRNLIKFFSTLDVPQIFSLVFLGFFVTAGAGEVAFILLFWNRFSSTMNPGFPMMFFTFGIMVVVMGVSEIQKLYREWQKEQSEGGSS